MPRKMDFTAVTLLLVVAAHATARAEEPEGAVGKLARVLIHHSLGIKKGDQLFVLTSPEADELNTAVFREAMKAGAHVSMVTKVPHQDELFYRLASKEQLAFISPSMQYVAEKADAILAIEARSNLRSLAGVAPDRLATRKRTMGQLFQTIRQRIGKGTVRFCETGFPTGATAQEAGMSLLDHREFVFVAERLHQPDPVAAWRRVSAEQERLVKRLAGHDKVTLTGKNIRLTLSIRGRKFLSGDGRINFPDGEIFTSPVETSVNGWVRFGYPQLLHGQELEGVQLWITDGKVARATAARGEAALRALLATDPGASVIAELGIGTNYELKRASRITLLDEKIGGTVHLAVGSGFPQAGGKNRSAVHHDLICDLRDGEIRVDDELVYKNGRFVEVAR